MQYDPRDELVINYADFKMTGKLLSRVFDIPHMRALEQLSRIFGYSGLHEMATKFGPNGTRSRGNSQPNAAQLERRLVQFFGPINATLSPPLTAKLLRLRD